MRSARWPSNIGSSSATKKNHWIQLFERPYDRAIAPEADLRQIGAQILADAGMDGLDRIRRWGILALSGGLISFIIFVLNL